MERDVKETLRNAGIDLSFLLDIPEAQLQTVLFQTDLTLAQFWKKVIHVQKEILQEITKKIS